MKLYLSSIEIPTPERLARLVGKPLGDISVAVIPNAQDYYSQRAQDLTNKEFINTFGSLGFSRATTVDLNNYTDSTVLSEELGKYDLIWARGGNTFCLRYAMRISGFDKAIKQLLEEGKTYGGDSAGALVAGEWIGGIESADSPDFAEQVIKEGLSLVPYVVLPHADNPEFNDAVLTVRSLHKSKDRLIELKDSQAVIFEDGNHEIVEAE